MAPRDNPETVRRFVHEVLNAGDLTAVESLVAPAYTVHSSHEGLRDRPSLITWLSNFRRIFPDAHWSIEDMVCQDDKVSARLLFTGTQSGDFLDQPAAGRVAHVSEFHIFRLADGLILEHWLGSDNLQLLQQLDLLATMFGRPGLESSGASHTFTVPVERRTSASGSATAEGKPSSGDRFDKFTERARKVLTLAQEEATRFNHNYIGTEHLLLGLVREGEGVAAKVLSNLGVELNQVRNQVEFIIGRGDRMIMGEIGLTPRAKKVIELAVDEARRLGHHYIGTEHLLLGLVREGEGIAAGVLESLGVNLEKVRTQTIQVLAGTSGEGQSTTSAGDAAATPARPATRWTYLRLQVSVPDAQSEGIVEAVLGDPGRIVIATGTPIGVALQLLGAAGWELIGMDRTALAPESPVFYVFKRRLAR